MSASKIDVLLYLRLAQGAIRSRRGLDGTALALEDATAGVQELIECSRRMLRAAVLSADTEKPFTGKSVAIVDLRKALERVSP